MQLWNTNGFFGKLKKREYFTRLLFFSIVLPRALLLNIEAVIKCTIFVLYDMKCLSNLIWGLTIWSLTQYPDCTQRWKHAACKKRNAMDQCLIKPRT